MAIGDGYRESTESWKEVLLDLKRRGLQAGALLAVGNGAMGFWAAIEEVFPQTRHQRCWFHKMGNVLNALPKSQHGRAKADMQGIWMAATRDEAYAACAKFIEHYKAKYPKAVEKIEKDRDSLRSRGISTGSSPNSPFSVLLLLPFRVFLVVLVTGSFFA